jgi:hypothetical protein
MPTHEFIDQLGVVTSGLKLPFDTLYDHSRTMSLYGYMLETSQSRKMCYTIMINRKSLT